MYIYICAYLSHTNSCIIFDRGFVLHRRGEVAQVSQRTAKRQQDSIFHSPFNICITRCFSDFHLAALLTLTGSNIVNLCVCLCVCAKGSQRRKDTPCRRIDNNDNDDEVFQGSVLLWVFVAVVIRCSCCRVFTWQFICLSALLFIGQHWSLCQSADCGIIMLHDTRWGRFWVCCARFKQILPAIQQVLYSSRRVSINC